MAWTVALVDKSVFGNKRVHVLSCTADAATQNVDSGLEHITGFSIGIKSLSTAAVKIYPNSLTTGTALAGWLGCSGFVNGDVFHIVCFGR